jgi:hypothetical protein
MQIGRTKSTDAYRRVVLATLVAVTCLAATALAQYGRSRSEVTIFADPEFSGRSLTVRGDVPDLRRYRFNDRVSSIRIPAGETWEICQDVNYGNRCMTLTRSEPDLSRIGWNDRVSSLRQVRGGRSGSGRGGRLFEPEGPGITVFADSNYNGEGATFREDIPDLRPYDLSDKISSFRIARGEAWEVCQDIHYANRCQVFSGDESSLRRLGWDNRISSLRRADTDRRRSR